MPRRKKRLILVHGRSFKPNAAKLRASWLAALEHGIARDYASTKLDRFRTVQKSLVYYGDISNSFLQTLGKEYDEKADVADRKRALNDLKSFTTHEFSGAKARRIYQHLPSKKSWMEFMGDATGSLANALRIGVPPVSMVAPDMEHYWGLSRDNGQRFGSRVRHRLTVPLARALSNNEDAMLIPHSLGTMVAYDVL